jgi:hypothetical protein
MVMKANEEAHLQVFLKTYSNIMIDCNVPFNHRTMELTLLH